MAIPERKILFPKVKPSIPVKTIREAVKRVVEEDREKEKEEAAAKPTPKVSGAHRSGTSRQRRVETRSA